MEIVSDEKKISSLQRKFKEKLEKMAIWSNQITVWVGENVVVKAYYSSELGIWFAFGEVKNRYWNIFGLGRPKLTGSNSIVVEINFPFKGIDRRIAGVFLKDNGRILVCHRGRIGGGRPDVGYRTFWDEYKGETKTLNGERFAVIGDIDSNDFLERVKDFVVEVNRIKNITMEISGKIREEISEEEIEEGEFVLTIERDVQNYVVNNLESLEKGLKIYQTEYLTGVGRIDILAVDKNSDFVVIEIKAGIADISAFGQISSYMGAVQKELAKGKKVHGIIVANEFDEKLKTAVLSNPSIFLKKYKVTCQFEDM